MLDNQNISQVTIYNNNSLHSVKMARSKYLDTKANMYFFDRQIKTKFKNELNYAYKHDWQHVFLSFQTQVLNNNRVSINLLAYQLPSVHSPMLSFYNFFDCPHQEHNYRNPLTLPQLLLRWVFQWTVVKSRSKGN